MKVVTKFLIASVGLIALVGCGSSTKAVGGNSSAADSAGTTLPENLKSEGYSYYGLNYNKPMNMEVQASTNTAIQTGTQTTKLKEIKDGKAIYTIERTGNLGELLGNMEVSLEADGIYVKTSTKAKVGDRDLELPAQMTTGREWTTKVLVDQTGQKMDVTNFFKIVGRETVKTPLGTYDSIVVTSTGVGTMNGQNIRMETKGWYVKDRGMVKAVLTNSNAAGQKGTITIQEAK